MSKNINLEQLKKIAQLAKLSFTDKELESFSVEFANILDYIQTIKSCDTADIQDIHHQFDYVDEVLRQDQICTENMIDRKDFFLNATDRNEGGFITTSLIVSKIDAE